MQIAYQNSIELVFSFRDTTDITDMLLLIRKIRAGMHHIIIISMYIVHAHRVVRMRPSWSNHYTHCHAIRAMKRYDDRESSHTVAATSKSYMYTMSRAINRPNRVFLLVVVEMVFPASVVADGDDLMCTHIRE